MPQQKNNSTRTVGHKRPNTSKNGKPDNGKKFKPNKVVKSEQEITRLQILREAKVLWNTLRMKQTPRAEKSELVDRILLILGDRLSDVASKHDASRVVQSLLQYGTDKQRDDILNALGGKLVELSKAAYGHQLVQKCLRYGSKEYRGKILKAFKGHIVRLATHHLGATVLEEGYVHAWTSAQAWEMFRELYGTTVSLMPESTINPASETTPTRSLTTLLERHPDQKKPVLRHLYHVILKCSNKQLFGLTFIHRVLYEYMKHADPLDKRAFVNIVREAVVALVSSKHGARVASMAFGFGTAKDRKQMLKTIKPHVVSMATHDQGHVVLLKALACTDDTVLLRKSILEELCGDKDKPAKDTVMNDMVMDRYASKLFLWILAPKAPAYLTAFDRETIQHDQVPILDEKQNPAVNEKNEIKMDYTSKKDDSIRMKELQKIIQPRCRELAETHSEILAASSTGSVFLLETVWEYGLNQVIDDLIETMTKQLNLEATSTATGNEEENKTSCILDSGPVHLLFKRLLQRERAQEQDTTEKNNGYNGTDHATGVVIAPKLFSMMKQHLQHFVSNNRGCFLLSDMLKNKTVSSKLKKMLRSKQVHAVLKATTSCSGKEILLKDLEA